MSFANENPYQSYATPHPQTAALAESWERAAFIRRTYLHLALAMGLFVALEAVIFNVLDDATLIRMVTFGGQWTWLLFLGGFMVVSWIARSWASSDASPTMQYLGLGLYVLAQAVIFVPLLFIAMNFTDKSVLPSAAILTLGTFTGLTALTFVTRKDFSFLRAYLIWGGLIAMGLVVCAIVIPGGLSLGVWFSVAMIALASGYILYDTSNVMHHYRTDQHVAAALALFASVALLFWYVLQLLMAFNRD